MKEDKGNQRIMKKIILNNLPSKFILFMGLFLVVISSFLLLSIPLIYLKFGKSDNKEIIFVMLIAVIIQMLISSVSLYIMSYIGHNIVKKVRETIWEKLLRFPVHYYDKNSSGEIISRMVNDTSQINHFVSSEMVSLVKNSISIVGSIILLIMIDWQITLVIFSAVLLTVFVIAPLGEKEYKISKDVQYETAKLQGHLGRVLADIRLVKYSIAERVELSQGNQRIKTLFNNGLKEAKLMAIIEPFSSSLFMLILIVIFGIGAFKVSKGSLSSGAYVSILYYLFNLMSPCVQMTTIYAEYNKFKGACEAIGDLLMEEEEPQIIVTQALNENTDQSIIKFNRVSFEYLQGNTILHDVSFEAHMGERVAIVGPSGTGKTTIFSLIERFYTPQKGTIFYQGKDINSIPLNFWRSKIAYVSQESPIMKGTILDNLVYGLEEYNIEIIQKSVQDVELQDFIDSLPEKMDTDVGERGVKLSGGQRQRIAIARAMIRNPEILLLDEATAHLDGISEAQVQTALNKLMVGRTTLIIAHRLSTVKNAESLIVLEDGRVTGIGSHAALFTNNETYKNMVLQQELK